MPSSIMVLVAVHNGERFLERALESLRVQTWPEFEVLVVDDGSTDRTAEILSRLPDQRFSVHHNRQNLGLTCSLNHGLRLARSDYVARLDADDVAMPGRLAAQAAFLDQHPDVGIVGADCEIVDEDDRTIARYTYPKTHTAIRWRHFFDNGFCHSTVMLRRSVLQEHRLSYDERVRYAQDFDLWTRLLQHTRGANLSTPLVRWRRHAATVSILHQEEQRQVATAVVARELTNLLGRPVDDVLVRELRGWFFDNPVCSTDAEWATALLMLEMLEALDACRDLDRAEIGVIRGEWLLRLSRRMPFWRWHHWAQAALVRRNAVPHWPRIAYRTARHLWHGLKNQVSRQRR
jgi:glycosyltransferase involved in cell wall biosynthesis